MGKLLFNKSLPELLVVIMLYLFLCACQVQSPTLPALTVEVTTEIIPPVTPSPTPACTPLKPGMSITVHPY
ncbi:MAG TPA: hypothetical protein VKF38_07240, partial [Anaerolineaceae bacterium]|nr:hypothetical protein [Anaerolineaceae bacterium]